MNDADRFLTKADEARKQAENAKSGVHQKTWLRLAEEWPKLAVTAQETKREGTLIGSRDCLAYAGSSENVLGPQIAEQSLVILLHSVMALAG
jgi:hypothetical protein